jgi:hypothetical protein
MPYKTWGCGICGKQAPKNLREHGKFQERMNWLRKHYKATHNRNFKKGGK